MNIRDLFEANRNVNDPRLLGVSSLELFCLAQLLILYQKLMRETEATLEKWKHPDPYIAPTAPGGLLPHFSIILSSSKTNFAQGTKYERNMPAPMLDPPPKIPGVTAPYVRGVDYHVEPTMY